MKLYEQYKKSAERSPGSAVEMGKLTVADTDVAKWFWIKDAKESIAKDIQAGKFVRLCPKYKDGFIVVGGRAERWMQATWNRQEFILLPHNHRFSQLIERMSTGKVDTLVLP